MAIGDNSTVYLLLSPALELQEHQHDCTPNDLLAAYAALALRPLATPRTGLFSLAVRTAVCPVLTPKAHSQIILKI
ncbi:hypothetical protein DENIT_12998 [Pseudomonas veronii]|nr:hypothetical protein DENIT_12998 [Pseudomonas veronii]